MAEKITFDNLYYKLADLIEDSVLNHNCTFLNSSYELEILNLNGDVNIKTTHKIINVSNEPVRDLKSIIISASQMSSDRLNFLAFCNNNKISYEIIRESPEKKYLSMRFNRPLGFMEDSYISYSYFWEKMFPGVKEYYTLYFPRPCAQMNLLLSYAKGYSIRDFKFEKLNRFQGKIEQLPLESILSWDRKKGIIEVQFVPDIFCQYKFSWERSK